VRRRLHPLPKNLVFASSFFASSLAISYEYWLISGTALIKMMRGILVKVLLFASTGNSFTNVPYYSSVT
jgi:hypothetical protein